MSSITSTEPISDPRHQTPTTSFETRNWWKVLLIAVTAIYLFIGVIPFVPVEEDGMRIAYGLQSIQLYGTYEHCYLYAAQAGTHALALLVSRTLHLPAFDALSLLSAICAGLLVAFGTVFLVRTTGAGVLPALFGLLLFQETYISGYYPNSSIIAGAFLSIALVLATSRTRLLFVALSGVLFAMAAWCRIDAIGAGAIFFILLADRTRRSLTGILLFGISATLTGLALLDISGISVSTYLAQLSVPVGDPSDLARTLRIWSTVITLAVAYFALYGLWRIIVARRWRLAALCVLGPAPIICAYGLRLNTPKYLLYTTLVLSVPVCYALAEMTKRASTRRIAWLWVGTVFVAGQYLFTPAYEVMLSRSTLVATADYLRLRGAIAFSPLFWYREKTRTGAIEQRYRERLLAYAAQNKNLFIVSHDWMANHWIPYSLEAAGYRTASTTKYSDVPEHGEKLFLTRDSATVTLLRWHPDKPLIFPETLKHDIDVAEVILYIGQPYLDRERLDEKSFLARGHDARPFTPSDRFRSVLYMSQDRDPSK